MNSFSNKLFEISVNQDTNSDNDEDNNKKTHENDDVNDATSTRAVFENLEFRGKTYQITK